jgi:hypothetical protein
MLSLSPIELLPIISDVCDAKFAAIWGMEKWACLLDEEKAARDAAVHEEIIVHLSKAEYEALSDDKRHAVDLFIHAGCCMHKELNSCKGGNSSMTAWRAESGLTGSVKLMNRDNTATATTGSSAACQRAINVSGAGGVKATTLAGAIFNNQDDKKGQQDILQVFLITKLGYSISFPDTSNIRYHSHCNAATELTLHHSLYL